MGWAGQEALLRTGSRNGNFMSGVDRGRSVARTRLRSAAGRQGEHLHDRHVELVGRLYHIEVCVDVRRDELGRQLDVAPDSPSRTDTAKASR